MFRDHEIIKPNVNHIENRSMPIFYNVFVTSPDGTHDHFLQVSMGLSITLVLEMWDCFRTWTTVVRCLNFFEINWMMSVKFAVYEIMSLVDYENPFANVSNENGYQSIFPAACLCFDMPLLTTTVLHYWHVLFFLINRQHIQVNTNTYWAHARL